MQEMLPESGAEVSSRIHTKFYNSIFLMVNLHVLRHILLCLSHDHLLRIKKKRSLLVEEVAGWLSSCLACHKYTEAPRTRSSSVLGVLGNQRVLHYILHHSEYSILILVRESG